MDFPFYSWYAVPVTAGRCAQPSGEPGGRRRRRPPDLRPALVERKFTMRKMRRWVSLLCALVMLFCSVINAGAIEAVESKTAAETALDWLESKYATIYGDTEEFQTAKRLIDCYRGDQVFEAHYQADSEDALGMVATVVESFLESESIQTRAAVYSVSGVPYYQQSQTNSCGTASAL